MDSISTLHARVAALSRHRPADDPELVDCRAKLRRITEGADTLRARLTSLPPEAWSTEAAASV